MQLVEEIRQRIIKKYTRLFPHLKDDFDSETLYACYFAAKKHITGEWENYAFVWMDKCIKAVLKKQLPHGYRYAHRIDTTELPEHISVEKLLMILESKENYYNNDSNIDRLLAPLNEKQKYILTQMLFYDRTKTELSKELKTVLPNITRFYDTAIEKIRRVNHVNTETTK